MHTTTQTTPNTRPSLVLGVIEFLSYCIIFEYTILNIFGSSPFGTVKGFLFITLLFCLKETVIRKWRSLFKGTVYGNVFLKSDSISSIPIKDVEVSWGPYHQRTKQNTPVITNAKGEFHFDDLPLKHNLTLTAKLPNNRYVHHAIGEIEDIKWLLGLPWLGLPLSSGVPIHVDFVVPSVEADF